MISIFPLRPIQIVDVSFQLLRKKFLSSFLIALMISLPLQVIVWIFEISVSSQNAGENLTGRTVFIILVVQFAAVGISLTATSNVLSRTVGKVYCDSIFKNIYQINKSSIRYSIGAFQVGLQIAFVLTMLGIRFLLGQALTDYTANVLAYLILVIVSIPWVMLTLRLGFAVPVSTHEGGSFSAVRKRTKQVNSVHFFKLFGVYCISLFLILLLVSPSLTMIQILIAKDLIKSDLSNWAFFNIIISLIISSISTVYSYMLCVTYFNARIEYEGFDIAVATQQLEIEGSSHGKLFNSLSG